MTSAALVVRPVRPADRERWMQLFAQYREFYRLPPDPAVGERVWGWLMDAEHEMNALVAELDGSVVGIADHRRFARPSVGEVGLWLDDLFTDPDVRGRGIGRALIEALQQHAASHGWTLVRWITATDNSTARGLYDRVGTATQWVTYEAPARHGSG